MGNTQHVKALQSDNSKLYEGQIFQELLVGNFISLSSLLIRRTWFEKLGGFSERRKGIQDWDLWLRLAAAGGEVRLCREPLTQYRHHSGQMSGSVDDRLNDRLDVLKSALELPSAQSLSRTQVGRAFANAYEISAWRVCSQHPLRAFALYFKAARHFPFSSHTYRQMAKCILRSLLSVSSYR